MKFYFLLFLLITTSDLPGADGHHGAAIERHLRSVASASSQTLSSETFEHGTKSATRQPAASSVCEALQLYPRYETEKPPFEVGEISPICRPFVKFQRHELDRCGDVSKDPYSTSSARLKATKSSFTWASRSQMEKKGKVNIYTDATLRAELPQLLRKTADLKNAARRICCGGDSDCDRAFSNVQVSFCQPSADPNAPDPCVFGGNYKMPGEGYAAVFQAIHKEYSDESSQAFRRLAERNLTSQELQDEKTPEALRSGNIVLSSYISKSTGIAGIEPIMLHELGHACSMIRMQNWAMDGQKNTSAETPALGLIPSDRLQRALRATKWLDSARDRCNPELELPEAYFDFWEAVGETRGFAGCLYRLAADNQKQLIDRACPGLCPGHYLEESVGIAFSLLLGDLKGQADSVFPNTCDHVRDGQHPMVSDVADCLMQNSPRFRARMSSAYHCQAKRGAKD